MFLEEGDGEGEGEGEGELRLQRSPNILISSPRKLGALRAAPCLLSLT